MKTNLLNKFIYILFLCMTLINAQEVITLTEPFNASGGVALDADGNIYVADFGEALNNSNGTQVFRVYRDGTVEEFATGLEGASGNDFDLEGNLIQSSIGGGYISKISIDGTVTKFADNQIFGPVGVAVANDGTVYVADCGFNSIVKVTPEGNSDILAQTRNFVCPNGLTIDDDGFLYTCNFGNGSVLKINPDNREVTIIATIPSDRCGHLTYSNGFLYVVGRCSNQIYRVSLEGDVQLIAGTGERGNDDGLALEATFNLPNGIAASADGDTLFINDAVSLDGDCTSTPLNPVVVRMITGINSITDVDDLEDQQVPLTFSLDQNYPNPFNPSTKINYRINEPGNVTLKVYDTAGKEVTTLVDDTKTPGIYSVYWSGKDNSGNAVASGVYFYTLASNNKIISKKMMLIK